MQEQTPDHELPLQVQCEQCGHVAGAAIINCPARIEGNCPYQLSHAWDLPHWGRIIGGGLIAVAIIAVITQSVQVGVLLGILVQLVNVAMGANRITVLYNRERGILWQHFISFIGNWPVAVRMAVKSILRNLDLRTYPMPRYPASVTALYGSSAGFIIKVTLLDLLAKEVICLCRVTIYEAKHSISAQSKQVLLFSPGKNGQQTVDGDLENRIVSAVKHIKSAATVEGIVFPQTISTYELVKSIYPTTQPDPGQWLISLITADAIRKGFYVETMGIFKQRQSISRGNYGAELRADLKMIQGWIMSPLTDLPRNFLSMLDKDIERALKSLRRSDDSPGFWDYFGGWSND